jgi:catechol 2,3-dioxygenase-like lactoylglutathione lyase family enzyme
MTFGLHHVQLAIEPGSEDRCRGFYVGVLGMTEIPKPPALAARLEAHGCVVQWDDGFPGHRRFYTTDCLGNRLEFLTPEE